MSTEKAVQTATPATQTGQEETPWVAVFRAGKYPQGDFSDYDLDEIVRRYDPQGAHEAPISLDHQKEGPALGWVSQLKREGSFLYAKFRQLSEEFLQEFRAGRYKKPSVEIYNNYEKKGFPYLRAVTFLGVQSPAIKGLPQASFSEEAGQYITINFQEEKTMPDTPLATILAEKDAEITKFREKQKLDEKVLADMNAELATFKEKDKATTAALKAKDDELDKIKTDTERSEIKLFFETQIKEGKALPAWVDGGIIDFMMTLDSGESPELAKFAEAGKAGQPVSQRDYFKRFLQSLPQVVTFREIITKKNSATGTNNGSIDPGQRLHELTVSKMKECKDLTYTQAFGEVQKENPTLTMQYQGSYQQTH